MYRRRGHCAATASANLKGRKGEARSPTLTNSRRLHLPRTSVNAVHSSKRILQERPLYPRASSCTYARTSDHILPPLALQADCRLTPSSGNAKERPITPILTPGFLGAKLTVVT